MEERESFGKIMLAVCSDSGFGLGGAMRCAYRTLRSP